MLVRPHCPHMSEYPCMRDTSFSLLFHLLKRLLDSLQALDKASQMASSVQRVLVINKTVTTVRQIAARLPPKARQ